MPIKEKKEREKVYVQVLRILGVLIITIPVVLVVRYLLEIWFGSMIAYVGSILLLVLIIQKTYGYFFKGY